MLASIVLMSSKYDLCLLHYVIRLCWLAEACNLSLFGEIFLLLTLLSTAHPVRTRLAAQVLRASSLILLKFAARSTSRATDISESQLRLYNFILYRPEDASRLMCTSSHGAGPLPLFFGMFLLSDQV